MKRVLVVVLTLSASGALGEDVAVAREAFSKGQVAYGAGQYREALARFEESFKAKPHPSTIFNIARCQDQLGDFAKAMTSYKEYLRLAPQAADADQVGKAIVSLETRLQAKGLQHVLVYADPATTAQIFIDDANVGASPAGAVLKPGTHSLKIVAPGYDDHVRSFVVTSTRSSELTVSLRQSAAKLDVPPPPPPPVVGAGTPTDAPRESTLTPADPTPEPSVATTAAPAPRRRLFTWVAGGVAVAAAALSVGMLVAMNGNVAELNRVDVARTRTRADALVRDATLFGTVSTASAVGAGVAGVAAVVLFILEGR